MAPRLVLALLWAGFTGLVGCKPSADSDLPPLPAKEKGIGSAVPPVTAEKTPPSAREGERGRGGEAPSAREGEGGRGGEAPDLDVPFPLPPLPDRERAAGGDVAPRVYAKTRFVWVHYQPSLSSGWLGFLWLGGHAELKTGKPVASGSGCDAWYEVKPKGYVCVDKGSERATLDPEDPVLVALRPYAPKKDSPWPHRYGESTGLERYTRLPTVAEQRGREYGYDEHLKRVAEARAGGEAHKSLLGIDLTPGSPEPLALPKLPRTLQEERRRLLPLSTVAWSRDFVDESGRSWLLSGDLMWVPKDRVKVYPPSSFRGVRLDGKEARLPLAFFRGKARPQYALEEGGTEPKANGQEWPRLAWVRLTGKKLAVGKERYWEAEGGLYVREQDAVLPRPQETTPWGAKVGEEDGTGRAPRGRGTWLEISILGGWMIAYEGTRPVYATMVSPGRGGLPTRGVDPVETAATPVGTWVITGKFATATMVAPHEFIHSDVPWTQNFHGPHALHVAYWHDNWGEKMSAGCVNVSALDGKWLFDWTEPALPEGWHGIRWDKDLSPATQTVLHE
jgi:hypothetical protein